MALVTDAEISRMWGAVYQLGRGKAEIKASGLPTEAVRRSDFQAIEDAVIASGLDIGTLVISVNRATQRHISTKAALDAGRIPADLMPVIEDYLEGVFDIVKSPDVPARDSWIRDNRRLFTLVSGDQDYKDVLVRVVLDLRVRDVLNGN